MPETTNEEPLDIDPDILSEALAEIGGRFVAATDEIGIAALSQPILPYIEAVSAETNIPVEVLKDALLRTGAVALALQETLKFAKELKAAGTLRETLQAIQNGTYDVDASDEEESEKGKQ